MYSLAALTLLLAAADHWTTYLCLRRPIEGWTVTEMNPIASWLFENVGLVPGLAFDSAVTLAAVAFLLSTSLIPRTAKGLFLAGISVWTAWAVVNNVHAIVALGLSPLGLA